MPRIYSSTNAPLDFCKRHFPKTEESAFEDYGNLGDAPDGLGNCFVYKAYHPPYEDDPDPDIYRCHFCDCRLRDEDD